MNGCAFEKVIVIGYGQIANKCIQKLYELRSGYGYGLAYIEYENTSLSNSTELCEQLGIDYERLHDKKLVTEYLLLESEAFGDERVLIVSAGNFYIFPKEVVEKNNLTIINFHSALLPKYPGRNAQSWAIFCGESEAGATWHFVNEKLDAGKYIIQTKCDIKEDTKAYELTGTIMNMAYDGFCGIIDGVLCDEYDNIQDLDIPDERRVYKAKDVPGEGRFELTDSPEYVYRLLRATDYGKSDIFPAIKTTIGNSDVRVTTYKKIVNEGIKEVSVNEKAIFMPMDEQWVLRIKYKV